MQLSHNAEQRRFLKELNMDEQKKSGRSFLGSCPVTLCVGRVGTVLFLPALGATLSGVVNKIEHNFILVGVRLTDPVGRGYARPTITLSCIERDLSKDINANMFAYFEMLDLYREKLSSYPTAKFPVQKDGVNPIDRLVCMEAGAFFKKYNIGIRPAADNVRGIPHAAAQDFCSAGKYFVGQPVRYRLSGITAKTFVRGFAFALNEAGREDIAVSLSPKLNRKEEINCFYSNLPHETSTALLVLNMR